MAVALLRRALGHTERPGPTLARPEVRVGAREAAAGQAVSPAVPPYPRTSSRRATASRHRWSNGPAVAKCWRGGRGQRAQPRGCWRPSPPRALWGAAVVLKSGGGVSGSGAGDPPLGVLDLFDSRFSLRTSRASWYSAFVETCRLSALLRSPHRTREPWGASGTLRRRTGRLHQSATRAAGRYLARPSCRYRVGRVWRGAYGLQTRSGQARKTEHCCCAIDPFVVELPLGRGRRIPSGGAVRAGTRGRASLAL